MKAKILLRNYKARFTAAWKLLEKELRTGALRVGNDMDIRLFETGADMILVVCSARGLEKARTEK